MLPVFEKRLSGFEFGNLLGVLFIYGAAIRKIFSRKNQ